MLRSVRIVRHVRGPGCRRITPTVTVARKHPRLVDNYSGWVEKHRTLDKMLYEMMPATFDFTDNYPTQKEEKEGKEVEGEWKKEENEVTTAEQRLERLERQAERFYGELFAPFMPSTMMMPMMMPQMPMFQEVEERGMEVEEDAEGNVKYTIGTEGFKPDSIKVTMLGNELTIEAKEETVTEDEDGDKKEESRHMVRSFTVPRGVTKEDIKTEMQKDQLILSYKRPEPVSIPIGQQAEQTKIGSAEK